MSAGWEVAIALWIDLNVLFVLWRIFRAVRKDEIVVAVIEVQS